MLIIITIIVFVVIIIIMKSKEEGSIEKNIQPESNSDSNQDEKDVINEAIDEYVKYMKSQTNLQLEKHHGLKIQDEKFYNCYWLHNPNNPKFGSSLFLDFDTSNGTIKMIRKFDRIEIYNIVDGKMVKDMHPDKVINKQQELIDYLNSTGRFSGRFLFEHEFCCSCIIHKYNYNLNNGFDSNLAQMMSFDYNTDSNIKLMDFENELDELRKAGAI
jgi:hypothetical protein